MSSLKGTFLLVVAGLVIILVKEGKRRDDILKYKSNTLNTRSRLIYVTTLFCSLQGSAKRLQPGCMNAAGKLRQEW